jgi:hypothetical protein
MRNVIGLLLVGLAISSALAQKANEQTPKQPALIEQMRHGVTYENCVTRSEKCGSGRNPDCVRNYCTGYPHRKPGEAPLPVVCPQQD